MPLEGRVTVATRADEVARAAARFAAAPRVAFDLESNGLFVYKATICTVQLGTEGEVFVVDALAAPLEPLRDLLSDKGPIKVVHDVAFDARMLAELGVAVDKTLQSHDWGKRPFDAAALTYLATDVLHLDALDDALWAA